MTHPSRTAPGSGAGPPPGPDDLGSRPEASPGTGKQEAQERRLRERLATVRHRILVLSGKGGVGKSTVSANLAMALSMAGRRIGLLDVDIHGPSIPKLLGLEGHALAVEGDSIRPVQLGPNLKVMSIGFLLGSPRDAVVWRGPLKFGVIRQFLADVLGIVENIGGFTCPHCGQGIDPFGVGGGEDLAAEMGVPFLGRIPFDPSVVVSGDAGTPFVQRFPESRIARSMEAIVTPILARLGPAVPAAARSPGPQPKDIETRP